ncbi:MAG: hypothetical protein JJE55_06825 [Flavobacteriaceae bacterium]|nr:hypothetical protein [Flavobacteriaceae bacterium]
MTLYVASNQDFITALALATGSIETLFASALLNGIGITEYLDPQSTFEAVAPASKLNVRETALPQLKPTPKTVAIENQNLQDLTIQTSGSLEHIFEMAMLNGISITETPTPGQKYRSVENDINSDIVNYYVAKSIKPATGLQILPQQLFETGLFEYGLFE